MAFDPSTLPLGIAEEVFEGVVDERVIAVTTNPTTTASSTKIIMAIIMINMLAYWRAVVNPYATTAPRPGHRQRHLAQLDDVSPWLPTGKLDSMRNRALLSCGAAQAIRKAWSMGGGRISASSPERCRVGDLGRSSGAPCLDAGTGYRRAVFLTLGRSSTSIISNRSERSTG